jgi:hypothetical protein
MGEVGRAEAGDAAGASDDVRAAVQPPASMATRIVNARNLPMLVEAATALPSPVPANVSSLRCRPVAQAVAQRRGVCVIIRAIAHTD